MEEARKLTPTPAVLFFYCKHGNAERDNFLAIARSLLAQLLKHDKGLLFYFYQKCCDSGEAVLNSPAIVEELLVLAFKNCKNAYIILDGLDECPRNERKAIAQWFRELVEDLPSSDPDRLRCLFVSQDDGAARKDFAGLASIKIRTEDIKHDIDEFSRVEAGKVKEELGLSEEKTSTLARTVADSVGGISFIVCASDSLNLLNVQSGIFLLAKLVWNNLCGQTSIAGLEREIEPNTFPTEINDA